MTYALGTYTTLELAAKIMYESNVGFPPTPRRIMLMVQPLLESFKPEDLKAANKWLGTFSESDLVTVADGEETEAAAICATAPDPEKANAILNELFDAIEV